MNTLIVGGTSGLGLEIARLESANERVIVTGRHDPEVDFAEFYRLTLAGDVPYMPDEIEDLIDAVPEIDSLVYAAGFYQEGHIDELSEADVFDMLDVSLTGLILCVQHLLKKQGELHELVTVTSTSQWTPRELEPVYTAAKAGAAQFSNSMSLDTRVGKTLVVGPSGMATKFWDKDGRDTSHMMQPDWVADQIQELREEDYDYRFARILGATGELSNRVEIVETRG